MSSSRKARARTLRRQLERDERRLLDDRRKLADLSDGGSPTRAIEVESSSVVESRATTFPCYACGRATQLRTHEALTEGALRVRKVVVACTHCGRERPLFFKIAGPPLN